MRPLLALCSLCLLLASSPARAMVARPTSVEALARASELVIRGRVSAREMRWSEDRRHIITLVTLETSESWLGAAPAEVVVRVPGGVVGDIGQRVDGAPEFQDAEEVVVFLCRDAAGAYRVKGLALGKFRVEGSEAKPSLGGVKILSGSLPRRERPVETMPVEELKRRVRSAR